MQTFTVLRSGGWPSHLILLGNSFFDQSDRYGTFRKDKAPKLPETMGAREGEQWLVGRVLREPDAISARAPQEVDATLIEQLSDMRKVPWRNDQEEAKLSIDVRLDGHIPEQRPALPVHRNVLALNAGCSVEVAPIVVPGFLRAGTRDVLHALVGKLKESRPIGVSDRTDLRLAHAHAICLAAWVLSCQPGLRPPAVPRWCWPKAISRVKLRRGRQLQPC